MIESCSRLKEGTSEAVSFDNYIHKPLFCLY